MGPMDPRTHGEGAVKAVLSCRLRKSPFDVLFHWPQLGNHACFQATERPLKSLFLKPITSYRF